MLLNLSLIYLARGSHFLLNFYKGVIIILTKEELKRYRKLRGLSLRDVAAYCDVSAMLISEVENGIRYVTEYNHKQIVDGINKAYAAKMNGTFTKPPVNPPKEETPVEETPIEESTVDEKPIEETPIEEKPVEKAKPKTTTKSKTTVKKGKGNAKA